MNISESVFLERLESVIPTGKENAIHQEDLAALFGVKPATIKQAVRKARENGAEILSGPQGYWFAKDDLERKGFVRLFRKQAFTRLKTASPINSNIQENEAKISPSDAEKRVSEEVLSERK